MEFLLSDVLKSWNNIWNFKEGINCCNLKFCNMPLVREIGHSRLGKIVSWNCRWLLHPVDTTCWASCLPLQILLILKKCLKLYFPPFLNSYSITKESIWSGCWVVCCSYQCSVIPNKCSNLVEKEERCKSACDLRKNNVSPSWDYWCVWDAGMRMGAKDTVVNSDCCGVKAETAALV